jgi:ABC-type multidrug transport system fused ATPase/permease subunit
MDAWTEDVPPDDDLPDRIARLEARIEELNDASERCRKIALAAKATLAVGAAWMALIILGAVTPYGISLMGALTLTIGSLVAFGSNASTARQTAAAIAAAEQERTELIDRIDLQAVGAPSRQLR